MLLLASSMINLRKKICIDMAEYGKTSSLWDLPEDSKVVDHTIQGQLIQAKFELSAIQNMANTFTEEEIKKELIGKLLYEMWNKDCIEFTRQYDIESEQTIFRARIYAVYDDDVRILRENKVI